MSDFPYSEAEIIDFLQRDVPRLLVHLGPIQVPNWGQMTAQHMVEHLTGAVRLSMGRYGLPAPPPSPALDEVQAYLQADAPFNISTPNPATARKLGPVHQPSLAAAISLLLLTLDEFFDHYAQQPAATAVHPAFGNLNFRQWQVFHFKHFHHHLRQFGLIPTSLLPRPLGARQSN
ncbi:hypothetical protein GCM10028824_42180 [Hymenobacter segetis]|uniref:DUF1569 domain-containing protein n=1 Tax=Hymenobacter segetis TaxID=2025509 RepID=A0ABU9M1G7_9BACT